MTAFFLGIDGGATKTAAVLGDGNGRVLARALTGPLSLSVVSLPTAVGVFRSLLRRLLRGRPGTLRWTLVGLAGGRRFVGPVFRRALRPYGGGLTIINDSALGFGTEPPLRHGAVIIAGTGSHAVARGPRGEVHTSGLGQVLGDEGSGYEQGRLALRAAARAFDGRGPATRLENAVCRFFQAPTVAAIARQPDRLQDKRTVAALAPLVEAAALRGDRVARSILRETARSAADIALTAIRRAGLTGSVPVVEIGGLFNAPFYRRTFERLVRARYRRVRFLRSTETPAVAAYRLALRRGQK